MFLGVDWESIMPAISAVLIFGTVAVGILGLFSDSHAKGWRLTRSGWIVAGVMCLLGALTFVSGYVGQKIADAKERSLAKERTVQFNQQMGSLRRLQADMQDSLRSQRELFGVGNENLRASGRLQQQAQANTSNVLRRVFEESNRITPEGIAVAIQYSCLAPVDRWGMPTIRAVQVAIDPPGGDTAVSLVSRPSWQLSNNLMFQDFLSDLARYDTFEAWRDATVRIRITGEVATVGTPLSDYAEVKAQEEELRRRGLEFWPMRCPMSVKLYLNGREVIRTFGHLERTSHYSYVLELENLRVDPSKLPRFAGSASR